VCWKLNFNFIVCGILHCETTYQYTTCSVAPGPMSVWIMLSRQRYIFLKFLLASHLTPWQIGMALQLQAGKKYNELQDYTNVYKCSTAFSWFKYFILSNIHRHLYKLERCYRRTDNFCYGMHCASINSSTECCSHGYVYPKINHVRIHINI